MDPHGRAAVPARRPRTSRGRKLEFTWSASGGTSEGVVAPGAAAPAGRSAHHRPGTRPFARRQPSSGFPLRATEDDGRKTRSSSSGANVTGHRTLPAPTQTSMVSTTQNDSRNTFVPSRRRCRWQTAPGASRTLAAGLAARSEPVAPRRPARRARHRLQVVPPGRGFYRPPAGLRAGAASQTSTLAGLRATAPPASRAQGSALRAAPPLLQLALIRSPQTRSEQLWTFHHVLLDGWSVFHGCWTSWPARHPSPAASGPRLPERRPFADHAAPAGPRDAGPAEEHWRRVMPASACRPRCRHGSRPAQGGTAPLQHLAVAAARRGTDAPAPGIRPSAPARPGCAGAGRLKLLLSRLERGNGEVLLQHLPSPDGPADLPSADTVTGLFITRPLPARAVVRLARPPAPPGCARCRRGRQRTRRPDHLPLRALHGLSFGCPPAPRCSTADGLRELPRSAAATAGAHGLALRDLGWGARLPTAPSCLAGDRLAVQAPARPLVLRPRPPRLSLAGSCCTPCTPWPPPTAPPA